MPFRLSVGLALITVSALVGVVFITSKSFAEAQLSNLSMETDANEGSGMVASRQYKGVVWWLRDGGTSTQAAPRAALYAMRFENGQLQPVRGGTYFPFITVDGVSNSNWEDIALDESNNIWIGDIGANDCNRTQNLYKVKEPSPVEDESVGVLAKYTFTFPNPPSGCKTINSEAMFWLDGHLYIFTKEDSTTLYRVDLPASPGPAKLVKLGILSGGVRKISGSSISDDRERMVVQHHTKFYVYTSGNPALRGDDYVKDMISRAYRWSGSFVCGTDCSGTVEGTTFMRDSRDVAFVAESKEVYYAKPADYGDTASTTPTPPPTNPAPSPSTGTCAVTDKLVNPCRPWLGAAANKYAGVTEGDYKAQILAHEQAIKRPVDIAHTYHPVGDNQLSSNDKYFINRANTYLFTNWKPAAQWASAAGSNSTVNTAIDNMADSIKSVAPKKIFFTLNHEPENDVSSGGSGCNVSYAGSAGTPSDYKAMWSNVRKRFDARGATNVVWVMDYMNYYKWDCLVDDLYPGNGLVDWVMFNAYGYGTGGFSKAPDNIKRFVDLLGSYQSTSLDFKSKPWGVVEWNVHDMPATTSYQYYDDVKAIANNNTHPNLKAYMVFDSIGPEGNDNRIAYVDGKRDDVRLQHYIDLANSNAFKTSVSTPPSDTTTPSVPTGLASTSQTSDAISLQWSPSTDNIAVQGYRVYRNGVQVGNVTTPQFTDTQLTPSTAYSYAVAAFDAAGNTSARSTTLTVATRAAPDTTPPSAPTGLSASALASTQVQLTWQTATDNIGVTGYIVQREGATLAQVNDRTVDYIDSTVVPQTTYTYVVRAVDAAGNVSQPSNATTVSTPAPSDTTPPSTPSGLAATTTSSQVNLTWNPSADNVGVKDYIVKRGTLQIGVVTSTNFSDGTVEVGSTYSYTVVARDAAGNTSSPSTALQVTITAASTTPEALGLAATYFPNKTLSGPGIMKTDATVDFNWSTNAPLTSGIPADGFSARWTGRVTSTSSNTYTFYTQSDDGVRLWVNNELLIDDWIDHGLKERSATITLEKDVSYNIKLEYYENTGGAAVRLLWSSPATIKQIIPQTQLKTSSHGVTGSYFSDIAMNRLVSNRLDDNVNFTWADSPMFGVPADMFGVRWTGRVYVDTSTTYTFYTQNNDGVRLWVNNQLLIDDWTNHGTLERSGSIALTGGRKYDLKLEYYDNTGTGVAKLLWSSNAISKSEIPRGKLYDR